MRKYFYNNVLLSLLAGWHVRSSMYQWFNE